jgi:hypothetical protein
VSWNFTRTACSEPLPESFSTDQLIDLYKVAVEEYRFEVKLNWERVMYHLTLNSALVSIATGLLKIGGTPEADLFVAGFYSWFLRLANWDSDGQTRSCLLSTYGRKENSARGSSRLISSYRRIPHETNIGRRYYDGPRGAFADSPQYSGVGGPESTISQHNILGCKYPRVVLCD